MKNTSTKKNALCIRIVNDLYKENKKFQKRFGEINLISVFFHEIIIFLTSNILNYNKKIKNKHLDGSFVKYSKKNESKSKNNLLYLKNLIKNFFIKILQIVSSNNGTVGIDPNLLNVPNLVHLLKYKLKFHILSSQPVLERKINKKELNLLKTFLLKKTEQNRKTVYIVNQFLKYLKNFNKQEKISSKFKYLILGSNSILQTRIHAANHFKNKCKVLSCSHGVGAFRCFNEPIFGYGETSFTDLYFDYGDWNFEAKLLPKPVTNIYPKIIKCSSRFSSRLPFHTYTKKICKILYIPTSFSEQKRYGPFRDIDDCEYLTWQKKLIRCAMENLSGQIFYKSHPDSCSCKTKEITNEFPIKHVKGDFLSKINRMLSYDLYILDYFGTLYSLLAGTKKPIIFFDLGLRNMQTPFLEMFKNRVHYFKIDLSLNIHKQLNKSFQRFKIEINKKSISNKILEFDTVAKNNKYEVFESALRFISDEK